MLFDSFPLDTQICKFQVFQTIKIKRDTLANNLPENYCWIWLDASTLMIRIIQESNIYKTLRSFSLETGNCDYGVAT